MNERETFLQNVKFHVKQLDKLIDERDNLKAKMIIDEETIAFHQKCIGLTQHFITYNLNDRLKSIEDIINLILVKYWGKKFKIDISYERNTTNIIFKTSRSMNDDGFGDIVKESGGGVKDTVSFILRIAFLSYTQGLKIVFLDEPFKGISPIFKPLIDAVIKEISREFKIQIIIILNHSDMMTCADHVIHIESSHAMGDLVNIELWKDEVIT